MLQTPVFFLKRQWRYFLVALISFTRIPVCCNDFQATDMAKAMRFFPLVGILVGIAGALVFLASHFFLPVGMSVLLSMAATILLTGAFHEDGLADAIDGLGGGRNREQVLTIMADSRIGSYGAISLTVGLLIKYQALSNLPVELIPMPMVLVAGHALSRWCATLLMRTQTYVKPEGKSKPFATQLSLHEMAIATFFGWLPMVVAVIFLEIKPAVFFVALVLVAIVGLWFGQVLKRRIGGYTGDCLGAMQQLTEIAFYLGLLVGCQFCMKF